MSPFTKSNQTLITVCNLWPLTILLHDVKPSLTHTGHLTFLKLPFVCYLVRQHSLMDESLLVSQDCILLVCSLSLHLVHTCKLC